MAVQLILRSPLFRTALLVGLLGGAVHLDWHLARSGPHRLSFDLALHWLAAIPVFGFVAWYGRRTWPRSQVLAVVGICLAGIFLGQVVEPLMEVLVLGQSWEGVLRPRRTRAFFEFAGTGLMTTAILLLVAHRQRASGPHGGPSA